MFSEKETAIDVDVKGMGKALSIDLVLKRIIRFLPITDMRSCRLVNSSWRDAANKELREARTNCPTIDNTAALQSFLEFWGQSDKCNDENNGTPPQLPPFTRIILNLTTNHFRDKLLELFFQTVAPFLAELRLHVNMHNPVHMYMFINEEINERFIQLRYPNLTDYSISVEGYIEESVGITDIYNRLICKILENAPNIRHLTYIGKTDVDNNIKHFHWLIDTLKKRKRGNSNINYLEISTDGGMENAHFSRMATELPELKLETVRFDNGVSRFIVEDGFSRFVQVQKKSLKFLYVSNMSGLFDIVGTPTMEKLKSLYLENWMPLHYHPWLVARHAGGPWDLRQFEIVPSVDYGQQLPALKELILTVFDSDTWIQFMPQSGSSPVASVEVLKLPTNIDRAINLEYCIRAFPNLRILQIPATVVFANLVYKYLPQLQELHLDTCDVTNIDDILTGFSTEECAQVSQFTEKLLSGLRVDFDEDDADEMFMAIADGPIVQRPRPICVLRKLKVLKLNPGHFVEKVELKKMSGLLVLSKMESLQILDLGRRSSTALEQLAEVIEDMKEAGKVVQYQYHDSDFHISVENRFRPTRTKWQ